MKLLKTLVHIHLPLCFIPAVHLLPLLASVTHTVYLCLQPSQPELTAHSPVKTLCKQDAACDTRELQTLLLLRQAAGRRGTDRVFHTFGSRLSAAVSG